MNKVINKIKGIYGEVNLLSSEEQGNFKYIHDYQNEDEKNISRTLPYGMNDDDYFRVALIQMLDGIKDGLNNIGTNLLKIDYKLDQLQNKNVTIDDKINTSDTEQKIDEKVKPKSTAMKSGKSK